MALQNAVGDSALYYDGLIAYDAAGKALPAKMQMAGTPLTFMVDDRHAAYPVTIDPVINEDKKLTASDAAANDFFGSSVAISGDTAIVGAADFNSDSHPVYIFVRDQGGTDNWGEVTKLTDPSPSEDNDFGEAVAISGDTAIVGAAGDDAGSESGSAYIFALDSVLNEPPTANAGENQSIHAGDMINLDGTDSSGDGGTENLTYQWIFNAKPAGSTATLTGANTATPSFTADLPGDYIVNLTVTDGGGLSASDTVTVSSNNVLPNADAGPDQGTYVGNPVSLDGSGSNDTDGDPLTYSWTLITPTGSTATLNDNTSVVPTFVPDVIGEYLADLTVNDGFADSMVDQVTVIVITRADFAQNQILLAINSVASLSASSVTTTGNQNALGNFLNQALTALQSGNIDQAIES